MVVIRMSRGGAKHKPFYNIVVADSRSRLSGRFIERVGFYNPVAAANVEKLRLHEDRLNYWLKEGAKLSAGVQRLVKQNKAKAA